MRPQWTRLLACATLNGNRRDPAGNAGSHPFLFDAGLPGWARRHPWPCRRLIAFIRLKEVGMLDALKKLIGTDEEGKKRRQQVLEEEQREREERARAYAKKLKHDAEQIKQAEQAKQ